ncbi:hypothetical protein PHAVU_011G128100 [Phaseolus vulgaris]|uniref:50S ribosomal protein L33, chloroplastic n=1 Tax=Phaseolus vulgaris TaxID=3885 RepID=V7AGZ5_PHAVU|nr:hypothetical protein PHAVU_011G128100g [Phaseolus vulgaris]ESW04824.1 hypothetical protein PHAVU_011G128100g [Phaseolus vulgaris]
MASATTHVFSGLTVSCGKGNSFFNFNHSPSSSTLLSSNFRPFNSFSTNGLFSRDYLSKDMFCRPTRSPVVCMAGSKKKSKVIRLVSTAGTGFFYAIKKSKKNEKLELKKYDPKVKRHVVFKESK